MSAFRAAVFRSGMAGFGRLQLTPTAFRVFDAWVSAGPLSADVSRKQIQPSRPLTSLDEPSIPVRKMTYARSPGGQRDMLLSGGRHV